MGENDSVTATLYPGACTEMQTASSVNWPGVKLHLSNASGTTRLQRNHRCIYEGDTPLPLAYCVPPYFDLAYCVPPFFGLAYCVPFNNKKTTLLGVSIYTKKIILQYAACTCTIILKNIIFDVFAC